MNGIPGTAEKGPSVQSNTCIQHKRTSVQWNCETKHLLQGRTKTACCRANNLAEKKQGILIDSSFLPPRDIPNRAVFKDDTAPVVDT